MHVPPSKRLRIRLPGTSMSAHIPRRRAAKHRVHIGGALRSIAMSRARGLKLDSFPSVFRPCVRRCRAQVEPEEKAPASIAGSGADSRDGSAGGDTLSDGLKVRLVASQRNSRCGWSKRQSPPVACRGDRFRHVRACRLQNSAASAARPEGVRTPRAEACGNESPATDMQFRWSLTPARPRPSCTQLARTRSSWWKMSPSV